MGTNGKPLGTWKTNENIVNKWEHEKQMGTWETNGNKGNKW